MTILGPVFSLCAGLSPNALPLHRQADGSANIIGDRQFGSLRLTSKIHVIQFVHVYDQTFLFHERESNIRPSARMALGDWAA